MRKRACSPLFILRLGCFALQKKSNSQILQPRSGTISLGVYQSGLNGNSAAATAWCSCWSLPSPPMHSLSNWKERYSLCKYQLNSISLFSSPLLSLNSNPITNLFIHAPPFTPIAQSHVPKNPCNQPSVTSLSQMQSYGTALSARSYTTLGKVHGRFYLALNITPGP